MIEIRTVGGFGEVGKNCTAIKIDDFAFILDMGIHLDNYIELTENDFVENISTNQLIKSEAIPDTSFIKDWNIKAIIPSHAHLDHIGAIPFLSNNFNADILATPFTNAVIKRISKDAKSKLKNKLISVNPNSSYQLTENLKIEFVGITHSIPQTALLVIHTPKGAIVYANDFKFDNHPVIGNKPNFDKLKQIGDKGVLCLIVECLYASYPRKTPSEKVARELLREAMLDTITENKTVVATTFSSHLARLKSIIDFGKKMNRKVVLLGRSLHKYVSAGQEIGIINFDDVKLVPYKKQIRQFLRTIEDKSKYLFVVTGHQGEPQAVLNRLANEEFDFKFNQGDIVLFSCQVIPSETNVRNRDILDKKLKDQGVRLFTDLHTSGHASKEDLRQLLELLRPKNIIPAHGTQAMMDSFNELAKEMKHEKVHLMKNFEKLIL